MFQQVKRGTRVSTTGRALTMLVNNPDTLPWPAGAGDDLLDGPALPTRSHLRERRP
ncbi:hypothetical protein EDD40_6019 [Saccharothrix texasensis]|uniref:Uncharacterized protein n=1 Tax=Saccharothrix texasensis TaxID=103734 RepID=A0A3N1HDR9_9PSEU|nr:hypothetical protein EDD40_6019 [Saccharothrix texasensis]